MNIAIHSASKSLGEQHLISDKPSADTAVLRTTHIQDFHILANRSLAGGIAGDKHHGREKGTKITILELSLVI